MKTTIPTQTQLKTWPTETIWYRLRNALKLTTESLHLVAVLWTELKARGEDMSKVDVQWSGHLSAIAEGKLDPKILVTFGGRPASVLTAIARLPSEDQAKFLDPVYKVPVLTPKKDGTGHQTVLRSPASLKTAEAVQVFGGGTVRTPEEQRDHVSALRYRTPAPRLPQRDADPDAALLAALPLTPEQRKQLINYRETRRPPTSITELVMRWMVQHNAMKATPSHSRARLDRLSEGASAYL